MEGYDWLQWPAMAATAAASWLVGSKGEGRRKAGFWLFLVSNGLWVAWGWGAAAWALVALQFVLAALNLRGWKKSDERQHEAH